MNDTDDSGQGQQAAAAAGAALLGAAVAGPLGAIVGAAAAPLLVPFAERIWDEWRGQAQTQAGAVVGVAAAQRGVDPEQLAADVMTGSDEVLLLAGLAITAAMRTVNEDKIRALGRALANGLSDDDAAVQEQLLLVKSLEDLESPHLAFLDLMAGSHVWLGQVEKLTPGREPMPWKEAELRLARPQDDVVIPTIIGALERHGLILHEDNLPQVLEEYSREAQQAVRRQNLTGATSSMPRVASGFLRQVSNLAAYRVTPLGLRLLDYLRDAVGSDAAGNEQPRPSED